MIVTIAARTSKLSQAQVWEVYRELIHHHPHVVFTPQWITTTGDKDHITSLRGLEKTDFFTKEIDLLVLNQEVHIGVHSAKDLPNPMTSGLSCIALTKGLPPHDSLVFNDLPQNPKIATSSLRREQIIKELFPSAEIVDIRGTIEQRLEKISSGIIDALVVAEAALIRLELTHLNRISLPGKTADFQGQLAVVARTDAEDMKSLFSCINGKS